MSRSALFCLAVLAPGLLTSSAAGQDEAPVVFRSEVSLIRVDAQVVDRDNRAVTGLRAEDFVLLEEGRRQEIRNFDREQMPVDVLLLLDVSGSMQPHIQRIASASHEAMQVMGPDDRVSIMVFDRAARLRMPFRNSVEAVERELNRLLQQESFDGGTDVTRGLIEAARYIEQNGRRDARRAIVILTDDQTERERDEAAVSRALVRADSVLSALLAPDALGTGSLGGAWPSDPIGGPLGGIIFGRRGPYGRTPSPMPRRSRTRSAGTESIARDSGGDAMPVDDAAALETTLSRLRHRYALHFHLPEGVRAGEERQIQVALSPGAQRRFPGADVRFRRVYMAPGSTADAPPTEMAAERVPDEGLRRRPAVNERSGSEPEVARDRQGGWRKADAPEPPAQPEASAQEPAPEPEQPRRGGWRKLGPGEQP